MLPDMLAVDFGTSNTAAAVLHDGRIRRIPVEAGSDALPTAVFFAAAGDGMRIGAEAAHALTDGAEGRYMRALKSVLGMPLFHEDRLIAGRRRNLAGIVTAFLAELRGRAEAATGLRFRRVLSGRPVHFHTRDADQDARAELDLRTCYLAAGFEEVAFLAEPEAAALACHRLGRADGPGLIVDIGGGTSDFSVFRSAGAGIEILGSHGIRLGGTDFDRSISMTHAMPALGRGGQLRREFGPGLLPVPGAIYADLANWAMIPFLYTPDTRRQARDMARMAVDRRKMDRLVTVLEQELGHDLAFAVERAKIAANSGTDEARIAMGFIEPGLSRAVRPETMDRVLTRHRAALADAAAQTLRMAAIPPEAIGRVILVGGSSLMGLVADEALRLCPQAELVRSEAFTAVVDGLALATAGQGVGRRNTR